MTAANTPGRERWSCPHCNYSAAPNEILSVRSHFDAHSLECVRCLYRTETKATWKEAKAAYRLAAKPADEVLRKAAQNLVDEIASRGTHERWKALDAAHSTTREPKP